MVKVPSTRAAGFCARPDPALNGLLLYGPEPSLLAGLRRRVVEAVAEGDDMRLTRLEAEVARKDPALLHDALRERGFFPGRRVVLIERARETLADAVRAALGGAGPEDALLVLVADPLPPRSGLRKLFEGAGALAAIGAYPEPADPHEIVARIKAKGAAAGLTPEAEGLVAEMAARLDPVALDGFAETAALYALGRDAPLDAEALRALAPGAGEPGLDRLIAAVAGGEDKAVVPLMRRLEAAGTRPEAMLAAMRLQFRQMLTAFADPAGPRSAAERLFRGKYNPRRDAFLRSLSGWDARRAADGARALYATERALRSPGARPGAALAERCFIRLAILAAGR